MTRLGPRLALLVILVCAGPRALHAQAPLPLYRVFLTDGRSLTSFGEWAKLTDRVAFSMPLADGADPDLQLVTVPLSRVDWPRTVRYADAVRATHYSEGRAEEDFAAFSNDVAAALSGIAREPDPKRRLATAEAARAALAGWPQQHNGYRAHDVQQLLTLLDEVVNDLRAAAGLSRFEFGLVATTPPPPDEPLLPPPSTQQLAEELEAASTLAETVAERTTLLERLLALLDRAAGLLPDAWAARVRKSTLETLASEKAADAAYAKLAAGALDTAANLAKKADVRGLEQLRTDLRMSDATLGGKRPAEMAAVMASVDASYEAARRLRLSLDQRRLLEPDYRYYRRGVAPALRELERVTPRLEDIRAQSGPSPAILRQAMARFYKAKPAVVGTIPPPPLASVHALLQSAWEMADTALKIRMRAVESGDATRAGEASAAAAGALMMIERATADLDAALKLPTLP